MTANPLSPIPPLGPTTGMAPAPAGGRFKPIDPLRVLRQHAVLLTITGVVGVVLGVGVFVALYFLAPSYTSVTTFRVNTGTSNPWEVGTADPARTQDMIEMAVQDERARLSSEAIIVDALETPAIKQTSWYQGFVTPGGVNLRAAREDLMENVLNVSPVPKSSILQVSASTRDQNDAPVILDAISRVYLTRLRNEGQNESIAQRAVFVKLKEEKESEIQRLLQQKDRFAMQERIETLEPRASAIATSYQMLTEHQLTLRMMLQQAMVSLQTLQQQIADGSFQPTAEDLLMVENHPTVYTQNQRIQQYKELQRASAERLGPNNPETQRYAQLAAAAEVEKKIEFDRQLRQVQQQKLEAAQMQVAGFQSQIEQLQPQLDEARNAMTDLTAKLARYQEMERSLEVAREQLLQAEQSLTSTRVMENRPDAMKVQQYTLPTIAEMTSPRLFYVPGVAILVLGAVTGLVFLIELLDQRLKGPMDVKMLQDGGEVLGVLPDATEDPSGRTVVERVVERQPSGLMAEMFRQTRTAILAKMDRRGYKTLLLCGAQKGAGTTAVTHNLATSLALNGRKVLILDANLRRPAQAKLMDLRTDKGWVDVLQGRLSLDEAIQRTTESGPAVLGLGSPDHASPETFETDAFRRLLTDLEKRFDLVLIDASPALLASDCDMLAKHVDAIAIVARANRDKAGMVARMIGKLDGQRADLLGVILNGVRSSAGGYFRKNYRDFYQYADEPGSGRNGGGGRLSQASPQTTAASRS